MMFQLPMSYVVPKAPMRRESLRNEDEFTRELNNLRRKQHTQIPIHCDGKILEICQKAGLYHDSKSFVDMKLKLAPEDTVDGFTDLMRFGDPDREDVKEFVEQYFDEPGTEFEDWEPSDWHEEPAMLQKIDDEELRQWAANVHDLWRHLCRKMKPDVETNPQKYSLLYVPNPFIVPGGRFREFYYWDSYWIIRGLLLSEMESTARGMIENYFQLVEEIGFIPNGGRKYYAEVGRSQPPLLIPMVDVFYEATQDLAFLRNNIDTMEKEYSWWINNRHLDVEKNGKTYRLAQFNVKTNKPRPESYREDVLTTSGMTEQQKADVYADIASACESGWDFSSRWLAHDGDNKHQMSSIRTRKLVQVDLNAFLYWNETLLAKFHNLLGNIERRDALFARAEERKTAINEVFWDDEKGFWFDWDLELNNTSPVYYISGLVPLFVNCHGDEVRGEKSFIERRVLHFLKHEGLLEHPGGLPTSKIESGQQWDFPNVWSPMQHMAIEALSRSDVPECQEAAEVMSDKWILNLWRSYMRTSTMFEKYVVNIAGMIGGGGEYEVQEGFGWTNGVALMVLEQYGALLQHDPAMTSRVFTRRRSSYG